MALPIRVLSARPDHPSRREPSRVVVVIDTGRRSGQITQQVMEPAQALELAEQLLNAARIVQRVNETRALGLSAEAMH